MVCRPIHYGDDVIVYASYKQHYAVRVTKGQSFQSRFGSLRHDDIVGRTPGRKFKCSIGYVYILRPTPELHGGVLRHRTQILYPHDVSLILLQLEAKPGTVLLEAGTGSGAFTRAAARLLAPSGKVHTFETNFERFKSASEDFKSSSIIQVYNRNVCVDGFDCSVNEKADAIFLDLPAPWEVVPFCLRAYKKNGTCRFCSFSPCIEQTQKTCEQLRQHGFIEIRTVECVPREYKVVNLSAPCVPFGGKGVAAKKMRLEKKDQDGKTSKNHCSAKESDKNLETLDISVNGDSNNNNNNNNNASGCEDDAFLPQEQSTASATKHKEPYLSFVADPVEQPTHTGYLTFATLLPRI